MDIIKFPKYKIGDTVYCRIKKGSVVKITITNWYIEDNEVRYTADNPGNEDYEYSNISEDILDFKIEKLMNK